MKVRLKNGKKKKKKKKRKKKKRTAMGRVLLLKRLKGCLPLCRLQGEGRLYLATVLDLFSRIVAGWSNSRLAGFLIADDRVQRAGKK